MSLIGRLFSLLPLLSFCAAETTTEHDVTWGLQRISSYAVNGVTDPQGRKPTDFKFQYTYDVDHVGQGVYLYVLGTGVLCTHVEFGTRAQCSPETDFSRRLIPPKPKSSVDTDGMGTLLAGVAAGRSYGVAKEATIKSIRVRGKSKNFPLSRMLPALDWIKHDAMTHQGSSVVLNPVLVKNDDENAPALERAFASLVTVGGAHLIMSTGWLGSLKGDGRGGGSRNVQRLSEHDKALKPYDAAGSDASQRLDRRAWGSFRNTPKSYRMFAVQDSIYIGGTTYDDRALTSAITGDSVAVLAPGELICGAYVISGVDDGLACATGTGAAAALAAGTVAMWLSYWQLSEREPRWIKGLMLHEAQRNVLRDVEDQGLPNRLLYSRLRKYDGTSVAGGDVSRSRRSFHGVHASGDRAGTSRHPHVSWSDGSSPDSPYGRGYESATSSERVLHDHTDGDSHSEYGRSPLGSSDDERRREKGKARLATPPGRWHAHPERDEESGSQSDWHHRSGSWHHKHGRRSHSESPGHHIWPHRRRPRDDPPPQADQ
ncbi:hypothetical protein PYCC9005_001143 [Savitreella phatthalungensis]